MRLTCELAISNCCEFSVVHVLCPLARLMMPTPLLALLLTTAWAPLLRPTPASVRAPPPRAVAFADSRYRKSSTLYETLEAGRASGGAAPATRPVLLAPAGGWPQVEAAIKAGADAIYFGCAAGLNARARAVNFEVDELPALMERLHVAGLEGCTCATHMLALNAGMYMHMRLPAPRVGRCVHLPIAHAPACISDMCVNVLVFESEMRQAEGLARAAEAAGVDGLIVQDVGLAARLRTVAPALPLHASTQMSISDSDGARFAVERLGARTVVLTRELSVDDIAAVTSAVPDANVEVFVHGHMCVSYNGQCFSSEAGGGRSANRGQCAQQCRMPYGLMVDGELKELADASTYLLSPQDLCGLSHVARLVAAGVRTFKIEGRLKSAEYVYVTTLAYRRAIDAAWEAQQAADRGATTPAGAGAVGETATADDADEADGRIVLEGGGGEVLDAVAKERRATPPALADDALRQVFARAQDEAHDGHTPGFFDGPRHQTYVRGLSPSHRGVCAGTVVQPPQKNTVRVRLLADLAAGDGVAFGAAATDAGGALWGVHPSGNSAAGEAEGGDCEVTLELEDARRLAGVRVGDLVWRTQHAALQRQLKGALADRSAGRALVDIMLSGAIGEPLTVTVTDGRGRSACAATSAALQPATGQPLAETSLRKAVGQLGGTPLMTRHVDVGAGVTAGAWLPLSQVMGGEGSVTNQSRVRRHQSIPCVGPTLRPWLSVLLRAP